MTNAKRRFGYFYPAVFLVWAVFLLVRFSGHRYLDMPLPSAGFELFSGGLSKVTMLRNSITELQLTLRDEKRVDEKPHVLQNIGCAYYDLSKATRDRRLLDSAAFFFQASIREKPDIARFHYNFGRLFTDVNDQAKALREYELALRYDPTHVLALSNAGMSSYFGFNRGPAAAMYFARALAIDSTLPMCHYVLGLIGLDAKDYHAALRDFEMEIVADSIALARKNLPIARENLLYAKSLAHRNLMKLYSTRFPDREKATHHFDEYAVLENDPVKRENAAQEFRTRWPRP